MNKRAAKGIENLRYWLLAILLSQLIASGLSAESPAIPATAGGLLTFLDDNPEYKGKYWDDWSLLTREQRHSEAIKILDTIAPIVKVHMNESCLDYFYAPGEDGEQLSKSIALVSAISSVDPAVRDAWVDLLIEVNRSWWSRFRWHWGGARKVMKRFRAVCKTGGNSVEDAVISILAGPVSL